MQFFFKQNPLRSTSLFLTLYAVLALVVSFNTEKLVHFLTIFGLGLVLHYMFEVAFGRKKMVENAITSLAILFLLLHPEQGSASILLTVLITTVLIVFKTFFEFKGRPIMNPTVFAILFGIFFAKLFLESSPFVSWWGTSFNEPLTFIILLIWCAFGLKSWRKYYCFFAFLLTYGLLTLGISEFEYFKFIFTTGTIYFLAGFMLIEPKTSPVKKSEQVVFGVAAALLYYYLSFIEVDYSVFISLATVNVLNFLYQVISAKLKSTKTVPSP